MKWIVSLPLRIKWSLLRFKNHNNVYITRQGRDDGFGAQVHGQLSTMAFAHSFGIKYVHAPFRKIAFTPENSSEEEWVSYWDDLLRLGENQLSFSDLDGIERVRLKNLRYISNRNNVCFAVGHCHGYTDLFPSAYESILVPIRDRFWSRYEARKEEELTVVSIHVRRGDVNKDKWPDRYTDNGSILDVVKSLDNQLSLAKKSVTYRIYSQGNEDDFGVLKESSFPLDFRLDADPKETLIEMATSDILVLSKSSFSYVAGLLCKGMVVYEPFRHSPMKNWIRAKDLSSVSFCDL